MKVMLATVLAVAAAAPAVGQDPLAPLPTSEAPPFPATASPQGAPAAAPVTRPAAPPLVSPIAIPRDWRGVFRAIRSGDWAAADAGIATLGPHVLAPVARAELYTAKGSPVVSVEQLQALLLAAPDLPQAEQIGRMALSRGATGVRVVPARPMANLGAAPTRTRAKPVEGDVAAESLRQQLDPLLKQDLAAEAEVLLVVNAPLLTFEARAEAGQRIAWAYYGLARDADARRIADQWRIGATGVWAIHSAWISGLASWRLGDCEAASRAFREVAAGSRESELRAGGYYWAARAEQACRRPQAVALLMSAAAASAESFYGLLARETLGIDTRLPPDPHRAAAQVESLPNVQRVVALVEIGERALAEDMLRHQARIGNPGKHHGLIEIAKGLDLAGAQYWLGHFGPPGAVADPTDRYPMPRWAPAGGWRLDPALVFAHIRQESSFRTEVVSPAGAVGLMQVRPRTAAEIAARSGLAYSPASLVNPAFNLAYGQGFIEAMRRSGATAGQLPRVIAAYNAGATPAARWQSIDDKGDPLLWIESLTYWETRYYVPAVLRNMWVYQGLAGSPTPTLSDLAQHRWPSFPTAGAGIVAANP